MNDSPSALEGSEINNIEIKKYDWNPLQKKTENTREKPRIEEATPHETKPKNFNV
jgi:hypothetical protein